VGSVFEEQESTEQRFKYFKGTGRYLGQHGNEKLIEKIKKLMALSKSPHENEAMAALRMARFCFSRFRQ